MRTESMTVTADTTPDEIDQWIAPAFVGVDRADLRTNNRDGLGTDDVPCLMLQQEAYPDAVKQTFGDWVASREIRWADHEDDPLGTVLTELGLMTAGKYIARFVRLNRLSVRLTLSWPIGVSAKEV